MMVAMIQTAKRPRPRPETAAPVVRVEKLQAHLLARGNVRAVVQALIAASRADIQLTREIRDAAGKLGIVLHDHLIVARSGATSFKAMGLL